MTPPKGLIGGSACADPPPLRALPATLPARRIPAGPFVRALAETDPGIVIDRLLVDRTGREPATVGAIIEVTDTDACVVLHDSAVVFESFGPSAGRGTRHALMSLTKPVVGCLTGILVERGQLDLDLPVIHYVPELAVSGYATASARNLLDMRTGVRFREDYVDPTSEIAELERWIADSQSGRPGRGLYAYLATIRPETPQGGAFAYRSADTDVLGWVCERAAGRSIDALVAEAVWQPMGAEDDAVFLTDGEGTPLHDGGLWATAYDVARFGQLLLDSGTVPTGDGQTRQVVPISWLSRPWAVDADHRDAFATSTAEAMLPGGWYRHQMWFRPGPHGDVLLSLGIYGQMIYVCRRTRTVGVKLSSWSLPQQPAHLLDTVALFDRIGGVLADLDARHGRPGTPPGVVSGLSRHPRKAVAPHNLPDRLHACPDNTPGGGT